MSTTCAEHEDCPVEDPVRELCDAIRSALLYSVFAEEAGREGDPELQHFYRGLEAEEEDRAERARAHLVRALIRPEGDRDAL